MPVVPGIEKNISFHIERQFPAIYRESGRELIQLVKEYYRFLETDVNQSIYNSRRMFEYRDIDTTLEKMLIFFKNKYLADLPFDESSVQIVVKNILDLYRRKGTEEGLKLFFNLFFGEEIKVYYPAKDILKPSDSEWKKGNYLQMIPNSGVFSSTGSTNKYTYNDLINKTIVGEASRSKAVVDKINIITLNNTQIPIIFVNDISGEFIGLEGIISEIDGKPINFGIINGSFTSIEIDQTFKGPTGYEVGELVTFFATPNGIGARGLVSETSQVFTGIISYEIEDGGWGYSIDSTRLLVSNQILFTDVPASKMKEKEPVADQFGNTGIFIGQENTSIGIKTNTGSNFLDTSVISTTGRDQIDKITFSNSISSVITLSEAINRAVSLIEPEKTRFDAIVSGLRKLGDIDNDGFITAQDAIELQKYIDGTQNNQAIINYIENDFNTYLLNNPGTYSNYPARKFKLESVVPKNETSPGPLYPDTGNTSNVILAEIENEETVSLIFDLIGDYTLVSLNAANYNDPPALKPMSGNTNPVTINTVLSDAFDLTPIEVGTIVRFDNIDPGIDYLNDVFAIAEDSRLALFERKNQLITLESLPAIMNVGDEISQGAISGKIVAINSSTITVMPYSYYGFNSSLPIDYKGVEIDIIGLSIDFNSKIAGLNAIIDATTEFAVGRIKRVDVIDSGYGYEHDSVADVIDSSGRLAARGTISARKRGSTGGYWASLDSHLNGYVNVDGNLTYFNSGKYIQDSEYYQEFSYEIQSKLDINNYEDKLKTIAHVAGTKMFGKFNLEELDDTPISVRIDVVT